MKPFYRKLLGRFPLNQYGKQDHIGHSRARRAVVITVGGKTSGMHRLGRRDNLGAVDLARTLRELHILQTGSGNVSEN
ncbi:MAG: hypothetical protein R3F53_18325 [Gammaproteobacteria bacterium]